MVVVDGLVIKLVATSQSLVGEKRIRLFVSDREWIYKKIINASQDAIIMADKDGILRLWNDGAQSIFGYSSDEAVGKTLDLIIPDRFREKHWIGYTNVITTSVTKYSNSMLAVPALRRDGHAYLH